MNRLGLAGSIRISVGSIKSNKIETAESYKSINDSRKPAHAAKKKRDQVKIKETDQSPVDSTNDRNGQSNAIKSF